MGGMEWATLGKAIVARRVELGMNTQRALAETMKISTRIIGDLESGRRTSYDPATLARVEHFLQWRTGTIDMILSGSHPPDAAPDEDPDMDARLHRLRAIHALLPTALQSALLTRLDVLADWADRALAAALAGERPTLTAREGIEIAADLDDDQRRMLLAMLERVKEMDRAFPPPEVIVDARPRRSGDTPIRR